MSQYSKQNAVGPHMFMCEGDACYYRFLRGNCALHNIQPSEKVIIDIMVCNAFGVQNQRVFVLLHCNSAAHCSEINVTCTRILWYLQVTRMFSFKVLPSRGQNVKMSNDEEPLELTETNSSPNIFSRSLSLTKT